MSQSYTSFARAYAEGGELQFSEAMALWLLETSAFSVGDSAPVVIDFACGCGEALGVFAAAGWRCIGIDQSLSMLEIARERASRGKLRIDYRAGDIRWPLDGPQANLVTCMYDSLNHLLTDQDLENGIRALSKACNPDGRVAFDVYTPCGLAESWRSRVSVHTWTRNHKVIQATSRLRGGLYQKHLVGLSRRSTGSHLWRERHRCRAYSLETIELILRQQGFKEVSIYGWDDVEGRPAALECSRRAVFIAAFRS